MGRWKSTQKRMDIIYDIISLDYPMTVRQVFYRLVSVQEIANSTTGYNTISRNLVTMRQEGRVSWEWIVDRNRAPCSVSMWCDLKEFGKDALAAYHKDIWRDQDTLIEVWLEKDALSGIFEAELEPYRVTLNVGRGYDSWTSIWNAGKRYKQWGGPVHVLYFGDFDPSGEDMPRSLDERLSFFEASPNIEKIAILKEDIERFNLPPNMTKKTDTRQKNFIEKHGDISVELDALPVRELRQRIRQSVENIIDIEAVKKVTEIEEEEREHLFSIISEM